MAKKRQPFEELVIQSWWVAAILLVCYVIYDAGTEEIEEKQMQLTSMKNELVQNIDAALARKEELNLQINSQNDYTWIELTLMRQLGVVPQGQRKVYFQSQAPKPQ